MIRRELWSGRRTADFFAQNIVVQRVLSWTGLTCRTTCRTHYLHRIGRSGRYGVMANAVTNTDVHIMKDTERRHRSEEVLVYIAGLIRCLEQFWPCTARNRTPRCFVRQSPQFVTMGRRYCKNKLFPKIRDPRKCSTTEDPSLRDWREENSLRRLLRCGTHGVRRVTAVVQRGARGARIAANKYVITNAGKIVHVWVRLYLFSKVRISNMLSCAGADRLHMGKWSAFGKSYGTVARVNMREVSLPIRTQMWPLRLSTCKVQLPRTESTRVEVLMSDNIYERGLHQVEQR